MKPFSIALCALAILASYLVVFLPPEAAASLLREDGPVEQATVLFFLLASLALVLAWRLRDGRADRIEPGAGRRSAFLWLAALLFVCAGEEMSWGQRVFGWGTPEKWSAMNAQAETNLHNLALIEGGVRNVETRSLLRSLTNANRLFALFWLSVFVFVPLLDRTSASARSWFRRLGLPVAPLWIGELFVLNQGLFFLACRYLDGIGLFSREAFPLDELKEHNAALVYAAVGFAAWWRERAGARVQAPLPSRA
jgi:hypothetical protein